MNYPELNEKNVMDILQKGMRKEPSPKNIAVYSPLKEWPEIYFDTDVLSQELENISNLFGQTKIVHDKDKTFNFQKGKLLYDGSKWTDSDKRLAYFYFILSAGLNISRPIYNNKSRCSFLWNNKNRVAKNYR